MSASPVNDIGSYCQGKTKACKVPFSRQTFQYVLFEMYVLLFQYVLSWCRNILIELILLNMYFSQYVLHSPFDSQVPGVEVYDPVLCPCAVCQTEVLFGDPHHPVGARYHLGHEGQQVVVLVNSKHGKSLTSHIRPSSNIKSVIIAP